MYRETYYRVILRLVAHLIAVMRLYLTYETYDMVLHTTFMLILAFTFHRSSIQLLFDEYDDDKSGELSFQEFCIMMKQWRTRFGSGAAKVRYWLYSSMMTTLFVTTITLMITPTHFFPS